MKPRPPPNIPGDTEAERFDNAVRKMFTVSKEDLLKRGTKAKQSQSGKKPNGRGPSRQNGSSS